METGFMRIDKAAEYLGLKKSYLYLLVERREIPHYRVGRLIKFKQADLDAWMVGFRVADKPEGATGKPYRGPKSRPLNLNAIAKKVIAEVRGTLYTDGHEESDRFKGLRKEASHGAL